MISLRHIIILICSVQVSWSQVLTQGRCNRNIPTIQNFQSSRYLGRWYEQEKYPFIFELGGKCIYAEYGLMKNGDVSVYNFNVNELSGQPFDILGSAKIVDSGKLSVRFNSMPSFIGAADYWILDTDYENYSVVYSCVDLLGLLNGQVIWILTRERNPDPRYIEHARSVIKSNGLSLKPLQRTNQKGC